jgi:hypothetical protein
MQGFGSVPSLVRGRSLSSVLKTLLQAAQKAEFSFQLS